MDIGISNIEQSIGEKRRRSPRKHAAKKYTTPPPEEEAVDLVNLSSDDGSASSAASASPPRKKKKSTRSQRSLDALFRDSSVKSRSPSGSASGRKKVSSEDFKVPVPTN